MLQSTCALDNTIHISCKKKNQRENKSIFGCYYLHDSVQPSV